MYDGKNWDIRLGKTWNHGRIMGKYGTVKILENSWSLIMGKSRWGNDRFFYGGCS